MRPGASGCAGDFDDLLEGVRVAEREVGQDLPVDADLGLGEGRDQLRVRDANLPGSGVDAGDPQAAEVALPLATVEPGVAPLAMDGLYGRLPELGPTTAEPLRVLANAVAAASRLVTTFCARHGPLLLGKTVRDHRLDLVLLGLGDIGPAAQLAFHAGTLGTEAVTEIGAL